jgi:hypothetical protein
MFQCLQVYISGIGREGVVNEGVVRGVVRGVVNEGGVVRGG